MALPMDTLLLIVSDAVFFIIVSDVVIALDKFAVLEFTRFAVIKADDPFTRTGA